MNKHFKNLIISKKGSTLSLSKGFTIIELIVVIAIIAVLAGIVLVNVTGYTNKGKDSSVKGNLATILTNSIVWYEGTANASISGKYSDGTYNFIGASGTNGIAASGTPGDCTGSAGSSWVAACKSIVNSGYTITFSCDTTNCQTNNAQKWCASVVLKTGTIYCVDSTGKKGGTVTCASGACP